jgi:hypothetical protein
MMETAVETSYVLPINISTAEPSTLADGGRRADDAPIWRVVPLNEGRYWERFLAASMPTDSRFYAPVPAVQSDSPHAKRNPSLYALCSVYMREPAEVAQPLTRCSAWQVIVPDSRAAAFAAAQQQYAEIDVYCVTVDSAAAISVVAGVSARDPVTQEVRQFVRARCDSAPARTHLAGTARNQSPRFAESEFYTIRMPLLKGSDRCSDIFELWVAIVDPQAGSASHGAAIACVANPRIVSSVFAPLLPGDYDVRALPATRAVSVKPRAPDGRESIGAEVVFVKFKDGVSPAATVRAEYSHTTRDFVADAPMSVGWTSATPKFNRDVTASAAVVVYGVDDGGTVVAKLEKIPGAPANLSGEAAERSITLASFEVEELESGGAATVDNMAITTMRGVEHVCGEWAFGTQMRARWHDIVARDFAAPPFAVHRNYDIGPALAVAKGAVFSDSIAAATESAATHTAGGHTMTARARALFATALSLPRRGAVAAGNSIVLAVNVYGKSLHKASHAFVSLRSTHDDSDTLTFPLIAPNENLVDGEGTFGVSSHRLAPTTKLQPATATARTFDLTDRCAPDFEKTYTVEIVVEKYAPLVSPTILFCFSGLRLCETSAPSPADCNVMIAAFTGAAPQQLLCVSLARPHGRAARTVGDANAEARVFTVTPARRGRAAAAAAVVTVPIPINVGYCAANAGEVLHTLQAAAIKDMILSSRGGDTRWMADCGNFLIEVAVNGATIACKQTIVYDSARGILEYAESAISDAAARNDTATLLRYQAFIKAAAEATGAPAAPSSKTVTATELREDLDRLVEAKAITVADADSYYAMDGYRSGGVPEFVRRRWRLTHSRETIRTAMVVLGAAAVIAIAVGAWVAWKYFHASAATKARA